MPPKNSAPVRGTMRRRSTRGSEDSAPTRRLPAAADATGFLPFDRFMEISLYEPGSGFYDRPSTRLGRTGNFYTAPHVHALFGATIAAHLQDVRQRMGLPPRFRVVEVGAGDGTLAADIRSTLGGPGSSVGSWDYVIVERSAHLRSAISARLSSDERERVPWRFAPSVASEGPFRGVVLANELLDAFPVRRLVRSGSGWAEQGVQLAPSRPVRWETRPLDPSAVPAGLPTDAPQGSVLEVSPQGEGWVRELADHLVDGRILLIDYGAEEDVLLGRGSAGTLEAIRGHRAVDPISSPGTADLSTWVNFTRLRRVARLAGFREVFYGSLAEAMVAWGIDDVRVRREADLGSVESVKLRLAQKSFLLGFSTFKVLELAPGSGSSERP